MTGGFQSNDAYIKFLKQQKERRTGKKERLDFYGFLAEKKRAEKTNR